MLVIINKKKTREKERKYQIVDFAVHTDYRKKIKENEIRYKYSDLATETKKLWIIMVTEIPVGALGTAPNGSLRGLEKLKIRWRTEIIQTTALGGARGVMFIVVGNGHGDTSSNPGRSWLHFT